MYPTIQFICDATISKIWFIGRVNSSGSSSTAQSAATLPTFQIWRPASGDDDASTQDADYTLVNSTQESETTATEYQLFEIDTTSRFSFHGGDLLGSLIARRQIVNAVVIPVYLPSTTDTIFTESADTLLEFFQMRQEQNSSPLIAIESSKFCSIHTYIYYYYRHFLSL